MYNNKIEIIVSDHGQSFEYEQIKSELGPYNEDDNVVVVIGNNKNLFDCMENRHNKL